MPATLQGSRGEVKATLGIFADFFQFLPFAVGHGNMRPVFTTAASHAIACPSARMSCQVDSVRFFPFGQYCVQTDVPSAR